jgi:hypothetical protein
VTSRSYPHTRVFSDPIAGVTRRATERTGEEFLHARFTLRVRDALLGGFRGASSPTANGGVRDPAHISWLARPRESMSQSTGFAATIRLSVPIFQDGVSSLLGVPFGARFRGPAYETGRPTAIPVPLPFGETAVKVPSTQPVLSRYDLKRRLVC